MAWKLLFGSDVGLMSLITILMIVAIGIYLYLFLRRKMTEDSTKESRG